MILVGFNVFACALVIFISYACILVSILHTCSADGRSKAFRTSSSCFATLGVFYDSIVFMYFKPSTSDTTQEKVASVFYTTVIPCLIFLSIALETMMLKLPPKNF
jgi:olfactory receptor